MDIVNALPSSNQLLFEKCVTPEDMITFLLDHQDVIKPCLEKFRGICVPSPAKDSKKANELRAEGNDHFMSKKFGSALQCYTESILFAPATSDDHCLALGYANRSAVFYNISGKYIKEIKYYEKYLQDCCDDANRALSCDYPEDKAYKLHVRKIKCYLKLKPTELTNQSLIEALEMLKLSNYNKKSLVEIEIMIENHLDKCLNFEQQPSTKMKKNEFTMPVLFNGENPKFENVSSAIELVHSVEAGRHVQANTFIPANSVLFVEKPFASKLLPEFYKQRCFHCYTANIFASSIPCNGCTEVIFCSENCRDESWNKFHKFECRYLGFLDKMENQHLALKILVNAGLNYVATMKNNLELKNSSSPVVGLNKSDKYKHCYYTVYHLQQSSVGMENRRKMVDQVLMACQLIWHMQMQLCENLDAKTKDSAARMIAIKKSPFFNKNKYFIAKMILRHSQQLICNAVDVTNLHCDDGIPNHNQSTDLEYKIATAVYPSASMMNHSCVPNTLASFFKGTIVVRSMGCVEKGQQINTIYKMCHHVLKKRDERQTILKSVYGFDCTCCECTSDDSVIKSGGTALLCKYCSGPVIHQLMRPETGTCESCKKVQNCGKLIMRFITSETHYKNGEKLENEKKYKEALEEFSRCLSLRKLCLFKNHVNLAAAYEKVGSCHQALKAFKAAYDSLKVYVAILRETLGRDNIEYVVALDRITDLILLWIPEIEDAEEAKLYLKIAIDCSLFGKIATCGNAYGNAHVAHALYIKFDCKLNYLCEICGFAVK